MALLFEEPSMYSEMNNSVGCAAAGTAYSANRHTTTVRGVALIEIMVAELLIGLVKIACQILQSGINRDRGHNFPGSNTFSFCRSRVFRPGDKDRRPDT